MWRPKRTLASDMLCKGVLLLITCNQAPCTIHMGWYGAAVLRKTTSWKATLPSIPSHGLQIASSWRSPVFNKWRQQASFTVSTHIAQEPSVASGNASSRFQPSTLNAALPSASASTTSQSRRSSDGASASRQAYAQEALAKIEATRGVVSPFLRDSYAREHDYLRIRWAICRSIAITEQSELIYYLPRQSYGEMQSAL